MVPTRSLTVIGILCAIVLSFGPLGSEAELVVGNILTKDPYAFLGKFCFVKTGTARMNIDANEMRGVTVNVFLDVDWPKVYEQNLPCAQYVSYAEENIKLDQHSDEFNFNFRQTKRPHYWYLTVSNCQHPGAYMKVGYRIDFTNSGGRWDREFSFDEQGLFGINLCFLLLFLILNGIHYRGLSVWWENEDYVHPILKMLTLSLLLATAGTVLEFIHLSVFATNGWGVPFMNLLAGICDVLAVMLLMAIIIVISKGWTISTPQLQHKEFVMALLSLLAVAYSVLFIWSHFFMNPASTLYIYDSFPGYVILAIRLGTMAWMVYAVKETYSNEYDDVKRTFYKQFGIVSTTWFAALPLIVLVSVFLDPWVRAKTVEAIHHIVDFIIYSILIYMLWPTRASTYFKISAPDVMEGGSTFTENL